MGGVGGRVGHPGPADGPASTLRPPPTRLARHSKRSSCSETRVPATGFSVLSRRVVRAHLAERRCDPEAVLEAWRGLAETAYGQPDVGRADVRDGAGVGVGVLGRGRRRRGVAVKTGVSIDVDVLVGVAVGVGILLRVLVAMS